MPFLSCFVSKFMVGHSFWEKGWQKQMTENLGNYISRICLRFCRHPWDLHNIRNILLTEKVLCGWCTSSHTSITPSLTQSPKQIISLLNFQLSNFSSCTLSMVLLYFVFWIPLSCPKHILKSTPLYCMQLSSRAKCYPHFSQAGWTTCALSCEYTR